MKRKSLVEDWMFRQIRRAVAERRNLVRLPGLSQMVPVRSAVTGHVRQYYPLPASVVRLDAPEAK